MPTYSDNALLVAISPARKVATVTPSDSANLQQNGVDRPARIWVGGAGNVSIIAADDTADVVITGVPAGTQLPILVKRVRATGTTATNIVAIR